MYIAHNFTVFKHLFQEISISIEICINKLLLFGFKLKVSKVTYSLTGKKTKFLSVGRDQKPEKPHGRCLRLLFKS